MNRMNDQNECTVTIFVYGPASRIGYISTTDLGKSYLISAGAAPISAQIRINKNHALDAECVAATGHCIIRGTDAALLTRELAQGGTGIVHVSGMDVPTAFEGDFVRQGLQKRLLLPAKA
jgi:hypothetical protein